VSPFVFSLPLANYSSPLFLASTQNFALFSLAWMPHLFALWEYLFFLAVYFVRPNLVAFSNNSFSWTQYLNVNICQPWPLCQPFFASVVFLSRSVLTAPAMDLRAARIRECKFRPNQQPMSHFGVDRFNVEYKLFFYPSLKLVKGQMTHN
jgi:hypothetical protein